MESSDTVNRKAKTTVNQGGLDRCLADKTVASVETSMSNVVESPYTGNRMLNTYTSPLNQDYIDRFLSEILNIDIT